MRIKYVEDGSIIHAISQDVIYDDHVCEELMWAEIHTSQEMVEVKWQDNFLQPILFDSVTQAKYSIEDEYEIHTPYYNGARHKVDL